MKTKTLLLLSMLLTFALGACGRAANSVSLEQTALIDAYTVVAMTITSRAPTVTRRPSHTPFPSPMPSILPKPSNTVIPSPTATMISPTVFAFCSNGSQFINDVTVEDGDEFAPGIIFVKSWAVRNIGSCPWERTYSLIYYGGDRMDGENTPLGKHVPSGSTSKISVTLTAPDAGGTYTGFWVLADRLGNPFGGLLYVQIMVSSD
jgi:hypothetical protein